MTMIIKEWFFSWLNLGSFTKKNVKHQQQINHTQKSRMMISVYWNWYKRRKDTAEPRGMDDLDFLALGSLVQCLAFGLSDSNENPNQENKEKPSPQLHKFPGVQKNHFQDSSAEPINSHRGIMLFFVGMKSWCRLVFLGHRQQDSLSEIIVVSRYGRTWLSGEAVEGFIFLQLTSQLILNYMMYQSADLFLLLQLSHYFHFHFQPTLIYFPPLFPNLLKRTPSNP